MKRADVTKMTFLKFWVLFNCLEQLKCINSWKVSWELSGVMESLYTEMIKMAGTSERGILGLTEYFFHGILPSKEEPGISFLQRETEDIVSWLITLSMLPPTDAMLLSILKCLVSMLTITHPRPLSHGHHFYEFGVWQLPFPKVPTKYSH